MHLKVFHNLTTASNFVCGQDGCPHDFQSLAGFRRHVLCEYGTTCNDATLFENCESNDNKGSLSNQSFDATHELYDGYGDEYLLS
jgi:hypothetical protein